MRRSHSRTPSLPHRLRCSALSHLGPVVHAQRQAEKDLARSRPPRGHRSRGRGIRGARRGPGHRGIGIRVHFREAISSAAAVSASSKKPTATLMSLVTRNSKEDANDEDKELTAPEKMEQLDKCTHTLLASTTSCSPCKECKWKGSPICLKHFYEGPVDACRHRIIVI